jgi:hypothetical protein
VLLRHDTAKNAELLVLRQENAVPRRQIAVPVPYEPADRFRLAAWSSLVPRRRRREVFPITPGALPARHRSERTIDELTASAPRPWPARLLVAGPRCAARYVGGG